MEPVVFFLHALPAVVVSKHKLLHAGLEEIGSAVNQNSYIVLVDVNGQISFRLIFFSFLEVDR